MATADCMIDPGELSGHADAAARLLKALANPHRLQVLCALGDQELSVGELNARIALSQSALSQHLKVLRDDGLVTTRRASQAVYYRMAEGPAREVIQVLHRHFCSGPAARRAPRKRA
ncbi:MAG: ArsR/SmtB family transcription factor [Pseudomonadota bacterium]